MRKLYTSLVALKMQLSGGVLPAMMGVPEGTAIDPAATNGLGSLIEDARKGLLCPVKNCGGWYHKLTRHIDECHADIGGVRTVKLLLGISPNTPLVSHVEQKRMSQRSKATLKKHDHLKHVRKRAVKKARKASIRNKNWAKTKKSVTYRNLRNTCDAQIRQQFEKAKKQFGHIPLEREMRAHYPKYRSAAIRRWGTWNKAVSEIFGIPYRGKWVGAVAKRREVAANSG